LVPYGAVGIQDGVVGSQDVVVACDIVVGKHDNGRDGEETSVRLDEVQSKIIQLLAADLETTPEQLSQQLTAAGPDLPIDSLLAAEILVGIEAQFGVRLPADEATARNLKSVQRLAQQVWEAVIQGSAEMGETA
jgi:acyl carrier protein